MKTLRYIYLFFAAAFGLLGVVLCVRWGGDSSLNVLAYLVIFLPAVTFGAAFLAARGFAKRITHAISILLCVGVIVIWGLVTIATEMIHVTTTKITAPEEYNTILTWIEEGAQDN